MGSIDNGIVCLCADKDAYTVHMYSHVGCIEITLITLI